MGKRSRNILEELVELPWWASAIMAAVVYVAARWIAPLAISDSFLGRTIGQALSNSAPILAFLFLVPAPFSAIRAWRESRALDKSQDWRTISQMRWGRFEILLATAFERVGYQVERRGGAGPDGGVDLVLREPGKTTLVQCKHWNRRQVGVPVARDLYGAMNAEAAEAGIIVTGGSFTNEAQIFAHGKSIDLIDGPKLKSLLSYARGDEPDTLAPTGKPAATAPRCPKCNGAMVMRTATRGTTAGSLFWGCSRFPGCTGTRPV